MLRQMLSGAPHSVSVQLGEPHCIQRIILNATKIRFKSLCCVLCAFSFVATLTEVHADQTALDGRELDISSGRAISPRGAGGGHQAGNLQAQQVAKVPLSQAIDVAERRDRGFTIEATFEINNGNHYEIKILNVDGVLTQYDVDADNGQVLMTVQRPIERLFTRLRSDDIRGARVKLRQAITLAEIRTNGRAAEAVAEHDSNAVSYRVTLAQDGHMQEVRVTSDGRIVLLR